MKVKVTIGTADVHEAIQAWLVDRGIPSPLVGAIEVQYKSSYQTDWFKGNELKVELEFEVDSYSSQTTIKTEPV